MMVWPAAVGVRSETRLARADVPNTCYVSQHLRSFHFVAGARGQNNIEHPSYMPLSQLPMTKRLGGCSWLNDVRDAPPLLFC